MPISSNPITGNSPRPEQAAQGTPWWKPDGPHGGGFPNEPKACCGRCQGIVHDYLTSVTFDSPLRTYIPVSMTDWLLTNRPVRSTVRELEAEQAVPSKDLLTNCGCYLEYIRCHWSSKFQTKSFLLSPPAPDTTSGEVAVYLFYGESTTANVALGNDDLSCGGIILFNGFPGSWDDLSGITTLRQPLQQTDSDIRMTGDFDTDPDNISLQLFGWCIAVMRRKQLPASGPDAFDAVIYQPLMLYQLSPQPYSCQCPNTWRLAYNPLGADDHTLITSPFLP